MENLGTEVSGDSSIKLEDRATQNGAVSCVIHAQLLNTDPDGRDECIPESWDENLWGGQRDGNPGNAGSRWIIT